MNFKLRLVALLLVVLMCFTSCEFFGNLINPTTTTTTTAAPTTEPTTKPSTSKTTTSKSTTTTVPAFDVTENSLSKAELLARYTLTAEEVDAAITLLDTMLETSKTGTSVDEVNALYEEFETAFYHIAQQMTISMIVYYYNMSDEEASTRYLDTTDMFYKLQDKYNSVCRDMYLESPFRDELFEGWTEEEIQALLDYDPETLALKKEVDELQVEYDNLLDSDPDYDERCVEIYKQVVIKNNQLAKLYGYDNYYEYASKNVYGRDYAAEDLALFREYIVEYVVPSFSNVYADFLKWQDLSTSRQGRFLELVQEPFNSSSKRNYLIKYLESLEGNMGEGMRDVFENKNCLFSYNGNSHPTAFQTYLYEDGTPFCFFGSSGQDAFTVVHEIGHYYAAYTNPDIDNYDLCETHSQGNEFLFLTYAEQFIDSQVFEAARAYQLVNACYVLILATIIDSFEQSVYALDNAKINSMTSDDFDALMTEACVEFGGAPWVTSNLSNPYDYWRLVCISNPVYYISYAVSASAAVNILAIAEEDYDAAITSYTMLVEGVTAEDGFLGALAKAGLTTPFEEETFIGIQGVLNK